MAPAATLSHATMAESGIATQAWLDWEVINIYADAYTMGTHGDTGKSDNHWVIILSCGEKKSVRIDLYPDDNRHHGSGVIHLVTPTYDWGKSNRVVFRRKHHVRGHITLTVRQVVEYIFEKKYHQYSYLLVNGEKKGCRYLVQLLMKGFEAKRWIQQKSDEQSDLDEYLAKQYTIDRNTGKVSAKTSPVDKGTFWH